MSLTTRWLTEEQRQLAHGRIQRDTVGLEASKSAQAGFLEAFKDLLLYLMASMQNTHPSATKFQSVLPYSCRVPRLQHYYHSRPHSSPIACDRHRWNLN
ncbi:hypothetical protein BU26DRAFT_230697 [Trematosphaeria pertusa]|uniref:Uncharacterized protein n=1 Tax=Trematosphaeria pertusa TaxID=390896 RepID=A0A6A6IU02_9PLEO|nr:uncharacterized protein BU26DRAFT_230697 [Trematosphaeria pertusa]KAF2253849.1 hypothetical protein BU26DRAFT_230697 [Trematosphaeria pertusa]